MLALAILLVVISAVLHVAWNVKLQSESDPLDTATKAVTLGVLCLLPFIIAYWFIQDLPAISDRALFYGFLSGLAELGYFYFLSYSYKRGELSVVYPIARGSAPLLTFLFAVIILQEQVSNFQVIGVVCLLAGIWLVRSAQITGRNGVMPALATGLFIATYTIIDKVGLRYSDPIVFGGLKYFFTALCLLAITPLLYKSKVRPSDYSKTTLRKQWKKMLVIGLCIIATYQLILFALTMAPVALISPLRESASVLVTIWGIWKLKERDGLWIKIVGVMSIIAGITLLAL